MIRLQEKIEKKLYYRGEIDIKYQNVYSLIDLPKLKIRVASIEDNELAWEIFGKSLLTALSILSIGHELVKRKNDIFVKLNEKGVTQTRILRRVRQLEKEYVV